MNGVQASAAKVEDRVGPPMHDVEDVIWIARCREKALRVKVERWYDARKVAMIALCSGPDETILKVDDGDGLDSTVKTYLGLYSTRHGHESMLFYRVNDETVWHRV